MNKEITKLLNKLDFKENLIDVIVQDYESNEVLMLGYMNKEALRKTIKEKLAYFWSRSRNELWKKGETSGHEQVVKEIRVDCDGDALLLLVEQKGKGACHTGHFSCFHRKIEDGEIKIVEDKVFEPKEVYGELQ